jgi:hypothetical protein
MEKEFVPYELALRMKTLDYDEPCLGVLRCIYFMYWSTTRNTVR